MGSTHLHIDVNAKSIHEFVSPDSHFLREIVRNSYSRSHCYNLHSLINIEAVLDILGEHAYCLKGDVADDLLDIELLEEIAWHIGERYLHCLNVKKAPDHRRQKRYRNNVIDLPARRIKQANAKL